MTRRLGLIIPSSNRMVEEEMVKHYPEGFSVHVTRLRMTGDHQKPLSEQMGAIEAAAAALADAKCEVVSFHCTANSMSEGKQGETAILDALKRGGAAKTSSTATAFRAAARALDARRIALVTPYSQKHTEEEGEFLQACGCELVSAKGYGLAGSDEYCATPAQVWKERVLAARTPKADFYFLSCANIRSLTIVDDLEAALDRPVISSNQIVIWDGLRRAGWDGPDVMPGRLFDKALPSEI